MNTLLDTGINTRNTQWARVLSFMCFLPISLWKGIILYTLFTICFCSWYTSIPPDEYVDRSLCDTTYYHTVRRRHIYSITLLLMDDYAFPDILPHQTAVCKHPCPSILGYWCLYIYCNNCPKWSCWVNGGILNFYEHCQILFPGGFSHSYSTSEM